MKKILFAALFIFLLTATLSVHPAQATMLAASTRTPTPRFKSTPTRTPLPSLLTILPGQMSFFFGGGGGYSIDECFSFLRNYHGVYPVAFIGERHTSGSTEVAPLCIAGLPMRGPLRIKLATTGGKTIGSAVFESAAPIKGLSTLQIHRTSPATDNYAGESGFDKNNLALILINIWLAPDFPYSQLRIDASNDAGNFAGTIEEVTWDSYASYLYVPSANVNPFNFPSEFAVYSIKSGEQLIIKGINFAKNTSFPLGIYRKSNKELQYSNWVQSDSQGRVSISLRLGSDFPPGYYTLAVFSDPPRIAPGDFIEDIFANTCPGAPNSFLSVGDKVQVNPEFPQSNNVRSQAGLKGSLVGALKINQTATVIDGWRCVDQMVWWKVRTSAGVEGWTSEGKGNEYWLVPKQ